MNLNQDKLNWLFKNHYSLSSFLFLVLWMVLGAPLNTLTYPQGLLLFLGWIALGIVLLEVLSRLLLRSCLGEQYRFWLFGYCLDDHDIYGFRFRSSLSSKEIDHPIYDRVAFPAGTQPSTDLATNRSQRLEFTTNSLGFRGKEFRPKIKPKKYRMFCVGGSTTACGMCADEDTWPSRLQSYLEEKECNIEVINAGTLGWTSYQELLLVREELIHYKPDILILHEGWNEEFVYSSLGLGKAWTPEIVRNVRESYHLYTTPNSLISSTASVAFALAIQDLYRNVLFARNMSFDNRERWNVLRKPDYLRAWFDNMVSITRIARENNILVFALDFPGLTDVSDLPQHREAYVQQTRLTHPYADYQAISKKRISNTLKLMEPILHTLRADAAFENIAGEDKLRLFLDEIHLSAAGNDLFASTVSRLLLLEPQFNSLVFEGEKIPQQHPSDEKIREIREKIGVNPAYLERIIDRNYFSAKPAAGVLGSFIQPHSAFDIPQTRYTTW